MVRFLVGTIVDFGAGGKGVTLESVSQILDGKEKYPFENPITTCAPAKGLVLQKVEYPKECLFQWI